MFRVIIRSQRAGSLSWSHARAAKLKASGEATGERAREFRPLSRGFAARARDPKREAARRLYISFVTPPYLISFDNKALGDLAQVFNHILNHSFQFLLTIFNDKSLFD